MGSSAKLKSEKLEERKKEEKKNFNFLFIVVQYSLITKIHKIRMQYLESTLFSHKISEAMQHK